MIRPRLAACSLTLFLSTMVVTSPSGAQSITSRSDANPYPGVTIATIRTSGPACDVWAAFIDLCADRIHVAATSTPSSNRTAANWGSSAGVQVASNGDFYAAGPSVYGDAVGGGVRWPASRTGLDPADASSWFYHNYGWIAFGPGWVDFTHTEWVKTAGGAPDTSEGWGGDTVAPAPPPDTIALVSGFPELVTEGVVRTCPDPTARACFPDRGDMADRHPRTAMGLTADRETFMLVVVDGRTSRSAGMRGAELAWLMGELGAWQAFNLDGGGSSQLWTASGGTLNNAPAANGGSLRAVANHWGVFAGNAGGQPAFPGHCASRGEPPPCQLIGPSGGILEETGPCFEKFGPAQYWRTENAGHNGHLFWTNAFVASAPSNWARWNTTFAAAGTYRVEAYIDPAFGVYSATRYRVEAGGASFAPVVNQSNGDGWLSIGEFDFSEGGGQSVSMEDNYSGTVASNQHIVADALRFTRLGCTDEVCNGLDDDCDGAVPPNESDADADGVRPCEGDCDDSDGTVYPGAEELCDQLDNDCDGTVDNSDACGVAPECGDGLCNGVETCSTCPNDCGECGDAGGDTSVPDADVPDGGGDPADAGRADTGRADATSQRDATNADDEGQGTDSASDTGAVTGGCQCTTSTKPGPMGLLPALVVLMALLMARRARRRA